MSDYITSAALKATLNATGTSYADADIASAISAASKAIDEACGRPAGFLPVTQTRLYTPDLYSSYGRYVYGQNYTNCLEIDDLNALTSVLVDLDGDGTFETTWVNNTDFYLGPVNAPSNGHPWERIVLRWQVGRRFPIYDNSVQVVGSFGWATCPPEVIQYCTILATQLLLRSREAPFGVLMAGMEIGTSARLARVDPDFQRLLGHLVKPHRLVA